MSWEKSFAGKTVIVTGGGRGIGRAICKELYKLGAKVYAVSKTPDNLKSLKEECPSIKTITVDLGDWDATRRAIAKIEAVDMLVNNAGIAESPEGTFMKVTEQHFDAVCSVNVKAVINVSQIVARKMIDTGKAGSIVNISSVAGIKVVNGTCSYSLLKAGLDHLTKIMAVELGPSNIRVNSVNPGPVATDMVANFHMESNPELQEEFSKFLNRIPTPKKLTGMKDVVNSVLFLLSDSAPMITGTLLAVDGGYCVG